MLLVLPVKGAFLVSELVKISYISFLSRDKLYLAFNFNHSMLHALANIATARMCWL